MAPKEDPQAETSRLFTESLAGNFMQAALRIESDAVKRSKSGGDFLGPFQTAWEKLGREYFSRFFTGIPVIIKGESEHNLYANTHAQNIQGNKVEGHNVLSGSTSAHILRSIVSGHNTLSRARDPQIMGSLIVGHNALKNAVSPFLESSVVIGYNALSSAEHVTLKNSLVMGAWVLSGEIHDKNDYSKPQYIPQEDLPEDSDNLDPDLFSSTFGPHLKNGEPRYTSIDVQGCVIYGKHALEKAEGVVRDSVVFSLGGKISPRIRFMNSVVVTPTQIIQFLGEGQKPKITINKATWLMVHPKMTSLRDEPNPN